jgi:hypothetical protein
MQNDPYDDLLRNLARLIEQIAGLEQNMRHLQNMQQDSPHILGCAIVTGGVPHDQEVPLKKPVEVSYEIIDAGNVAYLTLALPSSLTEEPVVEFLEKSIIIIAAGSRAPVEFDFMLLPDSCSYSIRNGIVDATLVKAEVSPALDN